MNSPELLLSEEVYADFRCFLEPEEGERRAWENLNRTEYLTHILDILAKESQETTRETAVSAYPGQGLLTTPCDHLEAIGVRRLDDEMVKRALSFRQWWLMVANHPARLEWLKGLTGQEFIPPPAIESVVMEKALKEDEVLAPGDLGGLPLEVGNDRVSRRELLAAAPFIKLGRQERLPFVGSAMTDCWGSVLSVATMAASHCLCGLPRNGVFKDIQRQADLAKGVFDHLEKTAAAILDETYKEEILQMWKRNVMGVLEADPQKALTRAEALYNVGVRTFRIYSPEPGKGSLATLKALREKFGNEVEIFCGQVLYSQRENGDKNPLILAKELEEAGADGLYVGIGGGGRCTTAKRSGSVVDWPMLVWKMRGEVSIPIIAEGGASDDIDVSLLLGLSGIGVSRIAAGGNIESPGGWLYHVDADGRLFNPYGGEASARIKFQEGKMYPFGVPSFVEGETTKAYLGFVDGLPTIALNLLRLSENLNLALSFRNVTTVTALQALNPSPLRRQTNEGEKLQRPH